MHVIFRPLLPAALGLAFLVSSAAGQVEHPSIHGSEGEARPDAGDARAERSSATTAPAVLTGRVLLPDGAPAAGAVVLSSAGGEAVTASDGTFQLQVEVPLDAVSVQVTAVASGARENLVASARVELYAPGRTAPVRLVLTAGTACQPSWLSTFGGHPGIGGSGVPFQGVNATAVFDDGSGPGLYVGGYFSSAGGVAVNNIAKWDGASWSALGSGVSGGSPWFVQAMGVFDDGSGPALYVGGYFSSAGGVAVNNIAKWDGTSWSALGSGVSVGSPSFVQAMAVFDDGSGPALYVGGELSSAGGIAVNNIAKWDGATWSALGSGVDDIVGALAVFDDGSGSALYVGGDFTSAGGVAASRIAKWNGASWSTLASGLNDSVACLTVFDDGSGSALFAGGSFGGSFTGPEWYITPYVAKWNGTSWSKLGTSMGGSTFPYVTALTTFDDGSGPALVAAGGFQTAGGIAANGIAKWNGTSWSALGSGVGWVAALAVFDDGGGPALYADVSKWDGTAWSELGTGMNGAVYALTVFDDGGGPAMYAGGAFGSAGGVAMSSVAKWDGMGWSALGSGDNGPGSKTVRALAVYDDGSGPALYSGGWFKSAGGVAASNIAKWDGASWSALGTGTSSHVNALAVYDDGSGPALYAGGWFNSAGGVAASNIAKWDGASWSALGSGTDYDILALAVFDDGSGDALYAGGYFTSAGGVTAGRIAKWDGTSWSALGVGFSKSAAGVSALAVFDDGGGSALFAGGDFPSAGGVAASGIAKWDGTSWSALGSGIPHAVHALTVLDDGGGPALYAGGTFTSAGGLAASRIAKWDGAAWSALEGSLDYYVAALVPFDDGHGPALYAGGTFKVSPAGDSYLAKWGCPPAITSVPGCAGNPATLEALALSAPLGAPLPLQITGSAAVSGLGVVAYGVDGSDGRGCGLVVPGLGELLLALSPSPKTLSSGLLAGGVCDLLPLVPSLPTMQGATVYLQGAAVHLVPELIELTNALAVKLGP